MTAAAGLGPVDPADFEPWPLEPDTMTGWRGSRWCTYLGRIADIRRGDEIPMAALGGDIVRFQRHLVPSTRGGGRGELFGLVDAGFDDMAPAGIVRVVRDSVGTAAVGQLFPGVDPAPYRAGVMGAEWGMPLGRIGWELTRVWWSLPYGATLPDGGRAPGYPTYLLGDGRKWWP